MSPNAFEHHQAPRITTRHHPHSEANPNPTPSGETEFLGVPGQTLRIAGHVEEILRSGYGMNTYVMHDDRTGHMLEWSSARRYRITVGDKLRLSGVVSAHLHRNGVPVTRLRNCFNPMRMS